MSDLQHNREECHLCELYKKLPCGTCSGIHTTWPFFLWLWGGDSKQLLPVTGRAHPRYGHALWFCCSNGNAHLAGQLILCQICADLCFHQNEAKVHFREKKMFYCVVSLECVLCVCYTWQLFVIYLWLNCDQRNREFCKTVL